ncbi:aldo/keto reductase [Methanobrevibacter filiformis]|uniref:L-glyceraldehyde 3-phosphate reductase n=1 Tax=Methanobrevibacter filiformis TaxID=55758 RepID=A0A166EWK8_9EURY|nr:aldo/keto reductase [Methanobrevibacter filiformis]KZX17090.1 L-glyceraldehyde 3-phosphate reductase [Methanobrevibacter filiformis]
MQYKEIKKTGDKLSILGYGCMRYPRKNGRIDYERTENQIITAIENGVNYFDTAHMYPGSEETLGKILAKGYREKVKIATKLPIMNINTKEKMDQTFETELERLQTNYIDYYMLHDLTYSEWKHQQSIGVLSFIEDEKKKGRIINIGFSYHGNIINFKKIIEEYDWDFVMLQYNYLDEYYQAGKEGLEYASAQGLGILIMEPLREGMIINKLPNEASKLIENFKIKRTPAEWALRWLWNNPHVDVVISGMSREEDIEENVRIANDVKVNSLTEDEEKLIDNLKEEFKKSIKIDCTACGYCLPCPKGVDIPLAFSALNDKSIFRDIKTTVMYLITTYPNSSASNCTKCGKCEPKCPQHLDIMNNLEEVDSSFEKWYYKILCKIVKAIMFR